MKCIAGMAKLGLVVLAGVLLGAGSLWAQAEQTPLGDIARQKATPQKKAKKVITNDDLPKSAPISTVGTATSAGSSGAAGQVAAGEKGAAAEGAAGKGKPAEGGAGAKASPEEVKLAQERVDIYTRDEQEKERKYKDFEQRYATETDPFRRQVMEGEVANSKENLAATRKKREDAEKELAGLQQGQKPQQQQQQPPPANPPQ